MLRSFDRAYSYVRLLGLRQDRSLATASALRLVKPTERRVKHHKSNIRFHSGSWHAGDAAHVGAAWLSCWQCRMAIGDQLQAACITVQQVTRGNDK